MFAELLARSGFSFLRGASHPDELVDHARELGLSSIALCDRDGLYGSVRAHARAKETQYRVIVGAELSLATEQACDEPPVLALLVENQRGYENLCRLLTRAHADRPKGESALEAEWLAEHSDGLFAIVPAPHEPGASETPADATIGIVRDAFGERACLAMFRHLDALDAKREQWLKRAARRYALSVVASGRPRFHHPSRKPLADVMHCIRRGITLDEAGTELGANAEAYLRSEQQMLRLFPDHPDWVGRSAEIAEELRFTLDELNYQFPCELAEGESANQKLRRLTEVGLVRRYPGGVSSAVRAQVEKELVLIAELDVAQYFLSTWEIVEIARRKRILCQGRGSAANSAVCYALGITAVDPARSNLLFERFLSLERREPPDIDVDFEHERREEVIQEIYERYGRDRAAMVSEVICYRGKSALREVGKAFGFSLEQIDRLSGTITHWDTAEIADKRLRDMGFDTRDGRLRQIVAMARLLQGFPRHLSIHVGGFVLSARPLHEVAPVEPARMEDRTVVPWDKDDLEQLGFFKVDVLGLGMLTAIRKALLMIGEGGGLGCSPIEACSQRGAADGAAESQSGAAESQSGAAESQSGAAESQSGATESQSGATESQSGATESQPNSDWFDPLEVITRIPPEDPAVYELVSRADTVGVFQIESRAQMAMLPRLRPRCFYDLVIEVAIVRPGPIQGGMVHPYLRRRNGEEHHEPPHRDLEPILKRTLGVPLFQEQVMQIAITGAGYSGGEADQLRRDMAAWKKTGRLMRHRQRLLDGFSRKGIDEKFGEALFEQIKGFGDYGFPESHASSFALLVYASSWQKAHYPAHFICAVLNSQPMGFYAPSTLVRDAQHHGVEVRDVCVLESFWDSTLEASSEKCRIQSRAVGAKKALRLGLRLVKGLGEAAACRIEDARSAQRFTSIEDLVRRASLKKDEVEALAEAGAVEALEPGRRQALWRARAPRVQGLFRDVDVVEPKVHLPKLRPTEQLLLDYGRKSLSVHDHPMKHWRKRLKRRGVVRATDLQYLNRGARVSVAGLVLSRQQPGTASGVVFMTLEDETGFMNLILYRAIFEQFHLVARHATLLLAHGTIEREQNPQSTSSQPGPAPEVHTPVIHVIVEDLERLDVPGQAPRSISRDFH